MDEFTIYLVVFDKFEMDQIADQKTVKFQDQLDSENSNNVAVDKSIEGKQEFTPDTTYADREAISSNDDVEATDVELNDDEEGKKGFGYLPARFRNPDLIKGYGRGNADALYRTTSSDYGSRPPNALTLPEKYYGFTRKFTTHLSDCGMYRNHSVNLKK